MTRKVRSARPDDLPSLEALKRATSYPGSLFFDEKSYFEVALKRLRDCLPRLKELPEWRVLVVLEDGEIRGYLVFVVDEEHGVTHQLEAHILDFAVFSFEALEALVARLRRIATAFENEYSVVDLPPSDKRLQMWFFRCGFRPEQNRVAKKFCKGHQGAASPEFPVRPARQEDLPRILEIRAAYSHAYLPAGRDMDLEALEFRYQLTYLALDLDGADGSHYLVMEDASSGACAGFIFIQPGPLLGKTPSYYIYDIAVAPEYGGRGLSRYLTGAAETLAGQEGALIYGDGTLGTSTLTSWHRQVGLTVDTVRFALKFCLTC